MARKGLPATYLKAAWKTKGANKKNALKRAWAAYRKSKSGKSSSSKSSKKTTSKKGGRKTGKKNKRRRKREITIPIAIVAPIAGNLAWAYQSHSKWSGRLNLVSALYTGYDPGLRKFRPDLLKQGLGSLIIGALIHKFVGGAPLNINRMLAAAKVPFIRI